MRGDPSSETFPNHDREPVDRSLGGPRYKPIAPKPTAHLIAWFSADAGAEAKCSCGWSSVWHSAADGGDAAERAAIADADEHLLMASAS